MARRVPRHMALLGILGAALALLAVACAGEAATPVVVEKEVPVVVEKEVPVEVIKEVVKEVEVPVVVEKEVVKVVEVEKPAVEIPKIHLRFNSGWPEGEYMSQAMKYHADMIELLSGGQITVENFYAGAIWKAGETPDALGAGLADGGTMLMLYYRGTYPVSGDGTTLPFGFSAEMAADAIHVPFIGEKIIEELAATNMVPIGGVAGITTWFMREPLPNGIAPADMSTVFEGLRIRGFGIYPDVIRLFGGSAVSFPSPEIPIALRQGQLDGFITSYGSWKNLGVMEDAPVVYKMSLPNAFVIALNKDKFDSFPPEVQDLMYRAGIKASELGLDFARIEIDRVLKEAAANPDIQVFEVSDEELARWQEAVQPMWDDFAAKGPDQQRWVDTLLQLAKTGYTPAWEQ